MNCSVLDALFALLALAILLAGGNIASAQSPDPSKPKRSMAALMAEGYEIQDIRLFPDKIWMKKPGGEGIPFICDRGRINSPAFEAYRAKRYDDISCLPTH